MNLLRELVVAIKYQADIGGLLAVDKQIGDFKKNVDSMGDHVKGQLESVRGVGEKLSMYVTAPLVAFAGLAVNAASESKQVFGIVESSIESMGDKAGFTAKQLKEVAEGIKVKSLYDDDDILKQVTTTLLNFGNVSGDSFLQAQQAVVDLSAKFGGDLQTTARAVGRALEFPAEGLNSLRVANIKLSKEEQDQIKNMVALGKEEQARAYLLNALTRAGSNAAEINAKNSSGTKQLMIAVGDLAKEFGFILLPAVRAINTVLKGFIETLTKAPTWLKYVAIAVGIVAAAIPPLIVLITSMGIANIFLAKSQLAVATNAIKMVPALWQMVAPILAASAGVLVWVAAIALAILIIQDLWVALNGGKSAISEAADFWFGALANFADWLNTLLDDTWKNIWNAFGDKGRAAVNAFKNFFKSAMDILFKPLEMVFRFLENKKQNETAGVPLSSPIGSGMPGLLARPSAVSSSNSSRVDVRSNITVQVPDGTPAGQADFVRKAGQDAVEKSFQWNIDHLAASSPVVQ